MDRYNLVAFLMATAMKMERMKEDMRKLKTKIMKMVHVTRAQLIVTQFNIPSYVHISSPELKR